MLVQQLTNFNPSVSSTENTQLFSHSFETFSTRFSGWGRKLRVAQRQDGGGGGWSVGVRELTEHHQRWWKHFSPQRELDIQTSTENTAPDIQMCPCSLTHGTKHSLTARHGQRTEEDRREHLEEGLQLMDSNSRLRTMKEEKLKSENIWVGLIQTCPLLITGLFMKPPSHNIMTTERWIQIAACLNMWWMSRKKSSSCSVFLFIVWGGVLWKTQTFNILPV